MSDGPDAGREPQRAMPATAKTKLARHAPGFVAAGLIALGTDAGVLSALIALGVDPFSARLVAIALAMVAAFFAHRRLTFAVTTPPTMSEFARFLAVAWSASAVNYTVYAAVLLAWPSSPPLLALLVATVVSMCVTYIGLRLGVFRDSP